MVRHYIKIHLKTEVSKTHFERSCLLSGSGSNWMQGGARGSDGRRAAGGREEKSDPRAPALHRNRGTLVHLRDAEVHFFGAHISLMNINITVNLPASPASPSPAPFGNLDRLDRSRSSKTVEKSLAFV